MSRPDSGRPPRLMARIRAAIRVKHYSRRTEQAYVRWIRRYIRFHGDRHPATLAGDEVAGFLTHLAVARKVAPATQNQALAAVLFLYHDVLQVELPWLEAVVRAKPRRNLPVVLSRQEVCDLLGELQGTPRLMASLLYGAGLRLLECCTLRLKDLDFQRHQLVVRRGKGPRTG